MPWFAPLLADFEWVKLIIPAIMVLGWALSQLARMGQKSQAEGQRNELDDEDDYQAWYDEAERQPAENSQDPIANEIETFLRKVRGEDPPASQGSSPVRPTPVVARTPLRDEPPVAEPIAATVIETVAGRTGTHDATGDRFAAQASRLGADVGHTGERVEQHMQEAFDHAVGSLADTSTPAEGAHDLGDEDFSIPVSASEYRDLLNSPESIRKAVVLNEILSRPTERW